MPWGELWLLGSTPQNIVVCTERPVGTIGGEIVSGKLNETLSNE